MIRQVLEKPDNAIEKIGVEKSKKIINDADLVIAIFDISSNLNDDDKKIIDLIKDKKAIILLNKVDILNENKELEHELQKLNKPLLKYLQKRKKA